MVVVADGNAEFGDGEAFLGCDGVVGAVHADYACVWGEIIRELGCFFSWW